MRNIPGSADQHGSWQSRVRWGGGQSAPATSTSTSTTEPPAYLKPYLEQVAQGAQANYTSSQPQYYQGQTIATPSAATNTALTNTITRATNGNPLLPAAQHQNLATINGQYLDPATNPNLRATVDYANQPVIDNYNNSIAPGNDARFSMAGRYGSGAHVNAQTQSQDSLNRTLAGNSASMYSNAYNTERGYQNAAIGQAPGLANADYTDTQALATAGATQDQQAQAQINADIQKHNYEQNLQAAKLQQYSDIIRGQNNGGTTTQTATTPMTGSSLLQGIGTGISGIGAAGSLASGLSALLPLLGFSDRRIKEDIREVGETKGGLPIYSYRYKADPLGVKHMGVMAQDVEKKQPQAFGGHIFGIKTVDYSKVA